MIAAPPPLGQPMGTRSAVHRRAELEDQVGSKLGDARIAGRFESAEVGRAENDVGIAEVQTARNRARSRMKVCPCAAADGRSVDRDLVLSVANAHPGKGVPEAIAAFTLAGVGGSRLVLVGDLQRDRAGERRAREALRRCSLPVARAGVVAPARLSELYARAAEPRKLVLLPGGHHRSAQHDAELHGVALRWMERNLPGGVVD